MAADPTTLLAKQRIIKLSADLEVQISEKKGGAVAVEILNRLRTRAAGALAALATINFDDPSGIIEAKRLQNEVQCYDDWLGWMRELIAEGKQYDADMDEQDREELLDVLTETEEGRREAIELGLVDDIPRDA